MRTHTHYRARAHGIYALLLALLAQDICFTSCASNCRIYALLLALLVAGGFRLQEYKKMQSLIKNISNRNENNVITQNKKISGNGIHMILFHSYECNIK